MVIRTMCVLLVFVLTACAAQGPRCDGNLTPINPPRPGAVSSADGTVAP
jgi:hypothetical protein